MLPQRGARAPWKQQPLLMMVPGPAFLPQLPIRPLLHHPPYQAPSARAMSQESSLIRRKRRWDDTEEQERPQVKRHLPSPNQGLLPRPAKQVRDAGPRVPMSTPQGAAKQVREARPRLPVSTTQVSVSVDQRKPEAVGEPGKWAAVTEALWAHYHARQHTEDLLQRKMELRRRLHEKLHTIFPMCGLYVVGSSLTGFGCNTSDADMCLLLCEAKVDQRYQTMAILHHVARLLARTGWCQAGRPQVIHAKVPILRFRDRSTGVEVDLNVNNAVGLRNTRLLKCYAQLDARVSPLVLAVKAWASGRHINQAKHGTLSSYSLTLMVIQFLQCGVEPAVLPCLQKMEPGRFPSDGDVRLLRLGEELPQWRSSNTQSLGALFVGFLNFYANRFSFSQSCVSVRLGSPLSRVEAVAHRTPGAGRSQWKYICIEEPFDQTNTARSVYDWDAFQQIVRAFHDTLDCLENGRGPKCLLLPPPADE
uniref:Putative polya rna polymerase gld-2 protein a n=1 Tax=Amblyomma triste TaxID=251400 RepID=A0A023GNI4_AMBTT